MNQSIFKAYDIRGKYPADINEGTSGAVGFGLARFLDRHEDGPVVVGCDSRLGSLSLAERATAGLQQGGREVIDIGQVTSPMLYFAVNKLAAAGGMMITASHNPACYNGFKLVREGAIPIAMGTGLEVIQNEAANAPAIGEQTHPARQVSVSEAYTEFLVERFDGPCTRKVVVDVGNGVTGPILTDVLEALRINYEGLFFEPDGRFPNHEANPLVDENLNDLRLAMKASHGSIGIAFDGDGDRVAFLDESGKRIRGDLITALIAESLLKKAGPAPVLYDLRSSHAVPEFIAACGGEPIRIRVGHSFIKQAMREKRAICGGELSYHYYFRDFFNCESGILAMLLVLDILEQRNQTLTEAVAPMQVYAHSDELNYEVDDPKATIERIALAFSDTSQDRLDGLTVEYADWWFNLRASNTEPLLRLNLEAETETDMLKKLSMIEKLIAG